MNCAKCGRRLYVIFHYSLSFLLMATLLLGCSTLQLKPKADAAIVRPPDYEETANYYLFGLVGKPYFDVYEVCHGRPAEQIQSVYMVSDLAIAASTLFLYFPKTVRVWCKE